MITHGIGLAFTALHDLIRVMVYHDLIRVMVYGLIVCVPLAIWKLIDIGIWIFNSF
tara:strand:+ start:542 stop:709 length:168 start_codon:yes stop_codon:yes gene_type:complete